MFCILYIRISIFTSDGAFVNSFGKESGICPYGLTFDRDGFLYVCDYFNACFIVY